MNSIRAVLFDFDGTLTLPGNIDFAGIKKAINCPEDVAVLEFIAGLPSKADQLRAWRILEQFEESAARCARPNDCADELVRFLRRRHIRCGILTRNRRVSVEVALRNFAHMRPDDFDVIITREHLQRQKPDPEGVLLAARYLCVPLAALLVVGDYRYDIEAGQRAGALTVFLESRLTTRRPDPPADYVIGTLGALGDIIDRLNHGK